MADFQLLPLPTVQYDLDVFWPDTTSPADQGGAMDGAAGTRYSGLAIPNLWTKAGNTNTGITGEMVYCAQVFSNGAGATGSARADGFQFHPVLLAGGPSATFKYPTHYRVWRWQLVWQLQAAAVSDTLSTFVGMVLANGGGPPNAPGNGYFGMVLSNTGRWVWVSRVTGALFGYAEQVDIMASDNLPHMLDLVIYSATGGTNAQLQVFLDGNYSAAPFLKRNWGPGSVLPTYVTTGKANATGFVGGIYCLDAAHAVVFQMVASRFTAGQFTPIGTMLQ